MCWCLTHGTDQLRARTRFSHLHGPLKFQVRIVSEVSFITSLRLSERASNSALLIQVKRGGNIRLSGWKNIPSLVLTSCLRSIKLSDMILC